MEITKVITKEALSKLPREIFQGQTVIVETEEELERALRYLSTFREIGFDTETRPSFSKKTHYKIALIQLSTDDTCFLLRLNKLGGTPELLESFLINKEVKKIGLSLRDDFHGLHSLTKITPGNFIDLQAYVTRFGIEDMSLQKIYAILFGKKISKRERLSNWEAEKLSEAQQRYAALDAWSCLRIYKFLENINV
ncbi:MAG: 3'-5' exonuclease domain-containing protein 2 [Tannerella sp.]|jgi:ribonuclease D|nr:3'-5' exonuclease domain-containing protein 2 [Tannerella sp.]